MGLTTTEAKHRYQGIMKADPATQEEKKPEKAVNQAHTYEHIKSLVLESTTETKIIKKNKGKNNAKAVIGIGI